MGNQFCGISSHYRSTQMHPQMDCVHIARIPTNSKMVGPWTKEENSIHIYSLELLGTFLGVQALAQGRSDMTIHLRMDSATTIAYIYHLGGTRSLTLCRIAKNLQSWCLKRTIILIASRNLGAQNSTAPLLLQSVIDRHDWKRKQRIFNQLNPL